MSGMRANGIFSAIQASVGNFFEAYDLIVFGTFAGIIGNEFFPGGNRYTSVMHGFMIFAAAYVMRVGGAIVLGPYIDRAGRRKGLMLSLSLMAVGTAIISLTPAYAQIGIAAPVLVISGRLIQGFAIGGETGGVTAYLVEVATQDRRAFYVCWNSICFHLAALSAISLDYLLHRSLTQEQLAEWGWRIPFWVGCAVVPVIFVMRKRLVESEKFIAQSRHLRMREVLTALMNNWRFALAGMFMVVLGSGMFYFLFTYVPIFAVDGLHLGTSESLISTIYLSVYCVVVIPVFAKLSDRLDRYPILLGAAVLVVITAFPSLHFLATRPSYQRLIFVQFWYATLYSAYVSASYVCLSELIPTALRATGYGLATTLGLAVFGGFTPLVAEWLVHNTGDNAAPSAWLVLLAICATLAIYLLYTRRIAMKLPRGTGSV